MVEWTEQKERSNPFALRLICSIALHLPRCVTRLFLWPITFYYYLLSPKIRFSSRQYLRRLPNKQGSIWQVIRHIHHFASTILDRVYFLTDQFQKFDIKINNKDCLDSAMASGKGAILLGSHVGSFEAMRCLAIRHKQLPLKILMYRDHNAMSTKVLDELNPDVANSVINLADDSALLKMKEALDQGCLIGMLGDRVLEGEKKVVCNLLGEEVLLPAGPFSLALMLGVPVVGFFGIYEGGNRYQVQHSLLYSGEKIARAERDSQVSILTQQYVDSIEKVLKDFSYNWFNFYDYWRDTK